MIFVSIMLLWIAIQLNAPTHILVIGYIVTSGYLLRDIFGLITVIVKSSHKQDKS